MDTLLYLAPLQGYTEAYFRNAYQHYFKAFDGAVSPFIPSGLGTKVKHARIRDLWKEHNKGMPVVPQILGKAAPEIVPLAKYLYAYGYDEININMGCPVPSVIRKQRGSGLLAAPPLVSALLEALCHDTDNKISLKMRLGKTDKGDIQQLLPIINQYPIHQLIIHPRTATQMYEGAVDIELFRWCTDNTHIPIMYSGDIFSLHDFEALQQQLPQQQQWMLGRGALYDIFLPQEIKEGTLPVAHKRDILLRFHRRLQEEISAYRPHSQQLLSKMKEYWGYFAYHFQAHKAIHYSLTRCHDMDSFRQLSETTIREAPWRQKPLRAR